MVNADESMGNGESMRKMMVEDGVADGEVLH